METEGRPAHHVSGEAAGPCKLGTFILSNAMRHLLLYQREVKDLSEWEEGGRECDVFSQLWQKQKCSFLGQA